MNNLIRVLEWLILAALIGLIIVGGQVWGRDPAVDVAVVPTTAVPRATALPAATATPVPPTDTPTMPPTWTPTSTPTATPTNTPSPTPTPTATNTPLPIQVPVAATPVLDGGYVVTSPLPQPSPMPLIEQPQGPINILLMGTDTRSPGSVARTDVMMIASIFPDVPSVSLISIPRDYYAWIPTWGLDKINTAYLRAKATGYPGGGPALVKATIEYNFGIPIHYYAIVDFNSYRSIVDAVGGVDIVVECGFHDTYPDPESETGQSDIDLNPGLHHLNGKYALWYVRSRWNTSDFDRHRRQQQAMRAILHQALNQNMLPRIPELWDVYQESVHTDMGLPEVLYLAPIAAKLDVRNIKSRFIRGSTLLESRMIVRSGYVLIPHYEALYEFMQEAGQPPVTSRAAQRAYRVEIQNGSGNSGWGEIAAYRLRLEGFAVTSIENVAGTARTSIVDYTTTSKGSPLPRLLRLYSRKQSDVTAEPTGQGSVDFRVILGWDYNPCHGANATGW